METENLEEAFDEENWTLHLEGEFGIAEFSRMIGFLMSKIAEKMMEEIS